MSQDNFFSKYSVEELQGYFSDFHKDYYGFRPRFGTNADWNSREWLETQINQIHDAMDSLRDTFEGRESLREQGWHVEETDPELAQRAKWLADERKRELDEQIAELDAKLYGDLV